MDNKAHYIILEDGILLSKKEYSKWQEIQEEYYEKFKACLGPWTSETLINYLEADFRDENTWPFEREKIISFFQGEEMILYSRKRK